MAETTDGIEAIARDKLLKRLTELEIDAPIVAYPAHSTVEEGKQLRGQMSGTFTKNLLLKDKKSRLFLLSVHEDAMVDLKTLHTSIGAQGRLGFASADLMVDLLGVGPGTLTPLALMNDSESVVTLVLDASLLDADQINFHPMAHTESIGITPAQLTKFLDACKHPPLAIAFD